MPGFFGGETWGEVNKEVLDLGCRCMCRYHTSKEASIQVRGAVRKVGGRRLEKRPDTKSGSGYLCQAKEGKLHLKQ